MFEKASVKRIIFIKRMIEEVRGLLDELSLLEKNDTIVLNNSGNINILQTHRQLTLNFTAWVTGLSM
ncbi:hypothetical protein [Paenibacillus sp. N3.4]|uniref:hypothetical protein n=1 Tax=Paenibacillus sp. N3.4 TaxID=2603222 RepID=UPI001650C9A4|nr:hypothetical protein [Paenibacillus sp. N3.4]